MNVVIYTKPQCPNCVSAKQWFTANNVDYKEINIAEDLDARAALLEKYPSIRSVPQILVETEHESRLLGGYSDLLQHQDLFRRDK